MKIYFIGQKGIPAVGGGVESYVDNLAARLAKKGHEVFVYTRWSYSDRRRKTYKGVNLINLPSLSTKNFDTISHTLLASIHVLFRKADIIHYHSIGPSSLLWLPKIFKRSTAFVSTFQSQCYLHAKWGRLAQGYLLFGEYILCRLSDVVIVPSYILQKRCQQLYNKVAVHIPNGVTIEPKVNNGSLAKWNLKKGSYIIAVSRLVRHKGLHYLIAAYQKLNTDKKLVIVGDGAFTDDYVRELKDLARNNKNIIFTGNQHGKILQKLYSHAYAFVQPSESEGLSIALLEAMSYGLPVLASDIEENVEAIDNNGIFFSSGDVRELENKLNYMLNNKEAIKKIGKQAKIEINEKYNWDKLFKEVLEVYQNSAKKEKNIKINNSKKILNYSFKN